MKIAVLPGDGIGTEIVAEAVKVLKVLDLDLTLATALAASDEAGPCLTHGPPCPAGQTGQPQG